MIVSSVVRRVAAGAGVLPLLLLSSPAAAADRPVEPVPPPAAAPIDRALLYRPGTLVRLPPGVPAPPRVSARAWLVADARTGDVLAAHDAHRPLPPASTLKALFALTALPRLAPPTLHTVSGHELEGIGDGSSLVGVQENVTYRLDDLWNGVFLSSGNDAVRVLAGLNGGWAQTARQMQATARALGAHDTRVVSPDGYDAPGQVSSAYDLAVFGRAGLHDPDFAHYCAKPYAKFPARGWTYSIRNTNRLVTGANGVSRYPGILGIKNGYTSSAGHTLIAAARQGRHTLVVTVLNPRRGGAYAVYEEARDLFDWGFAAAGRVRPVGSLLPPAPRARPVAVPAGPASRTVPPSATAAPSAPAGPVKASGAAAADDGPGVVLPVTFVASACLAAATMWLVRRRGGLPG
ncbi:D-alanyl-D-alanine carboxypeptidase family protein [Streptomyces sp. HMX112]|uniref:D-alanyl-D-alanine carboxypeptidase family protein n=1 Tax=Streptomyces sp. HMX112 TaxID=3390850 RepID=UPI003A811E6A